MKKRGPKTDEGKLSLLLSRTEYLVSGTSKLIRKFRRCDICPLGANKKYVMLKGKAKEFPVIPICKAYRPRGRKCVFPPEEFAARLRTWYQTMKNRKVEEAVAERVMVESIIDGEITKEVEIMKKGHPAGYTNMHREMGLKAAETLHKIKYGELQRNLNMNVNVSVDKVIKRLKEIKEEESGKGN